MYVNLWNVYKMFSWWELRHALWYGGIKYMCWHTAVWYGEPSECVSLKHDHHKRTYNMYRMSSHNRQKKNQQVGFSLLRERSAVVLHLPLKDMRGFAATLATCAGTKWEPQKKKSLPLWHSALVAGTVASQQEIRGFVFCVDGCLHGFTPKIQQSRRIGGP